MPESRVADRESRVDDRECRLVREFEAGNCRPAESRRGGGETTLKKAFVSVMQLRVQCSSAYDLILVIISQKTIIPLEKFSTANNQKSIMLMDIIYRVDNIQFTWGIMLMGVCGSRVIGV